MKENTHDTKPGLDEMKNPCTKLLKQEFDNLKRRNPSYSLRAFARDLDVCHSYLSKVLLGKKRPTPRLVYRATIVLKLPQEKAFELLMDSFEETNKKTHSTEH